MGKIIHLDDYRKRGKGRTSKPRRASRVIKEQMQLPFSGPPRDWKGRIPKLDEDFLDHLIRIGTECGNRLDADEPLLVIPWKEEGAPPTSRYQYPTIEDEWETPAPECAPYGNRADPENESS